MLKTYLLLAFRNLLKRKTSTTINVIGLAVGLACCSLVFLYFQHELAFDKGFDNADRMYRITTNMRDGSKAPTVALPYAKYLKQEIPEIKTLSRLDASGSSTVVKVVDGTATTPYLEQSGYWVDPAFFDLFSFHFLFGTAKTAFTMPNTIVLSQSLAQKLFGDKYPIGKVLKAGSNNYTVTGVFKENLLNHINAGFYASTNSTGIRETINKTTNWVINPNYYTYVKLKEGANVQHVINELHAYTIRHASADMKTSGDYMTNSLQALTDIHLHSAIYQDYLAFKQGNLSYLYLLASIAAAILLLGCVNYMNLSTAQAIDRAREVGVRRVLGADKKIIRFQFLMETLVISSIALVTGCILALAALPAFNQLTGQHLSFFTSENSTLLPWLICITLITGLLAGIYPAFYLTSFKTINALKGKTATSATVFNIRKVLVSGQFIIATCLIIATTVIWYQLQYMMDAKTGVDPNQQMVLNLNTEQAAKNSAYLIHQLTTNGNFQSVTGATATLISGDMNLYPAGKSVNDKHEVFLNLSDENYIKTLGLQLVSGSNFTPVNFTNTDLQQDLEATDIGRQVILNEEAVKALGYNNDNAVGKYVSHLHNGVVYSYRITGVVKNYHYFSLHNSIGPCAIMPANPRRFTTIVAKIKGTNVKAAVNFTNQTWKQINPDSPFDYSFLNDTFRDSYQQDKRQQQMMSTFTGVALLISCLGLFGLITYTLGQKTKEIGIRKVIGASIADIVFLFSKQYIRLILVSNLIAWPVAWYFMNKWLQDFPYRIQISWWMFAIPLGTGLLLALATLSVKTVKAALANPVLSLKSE